MSKNNKSNTKPISPTPMESHLVDIHEALHEEEGEEGENNNEVTSSDHNKRLVARPVKPREARRGPHKGFSRQVSLETGFSVLRESKARDERSLPRSGRSVGSAAASSYRLGVGGEGRKADFSMFMTKSSLSKQNSLLPSKNKEREADSHSVEHCGGGRGGEHDHESVNESVPVGRYYAALRGPELDQIKESEDILLPKDEKWPFLLRFPIGCYGICLGLSSQVVLWRSLSTSPATKFLHVSPYINLGLWFLALAILLAVSLTYTLKCILYFEAVKREYFHPVRVNFFFAPWVVCMFLAIGAPPAFFPERLHPAVWCAFMGPYLFLELKIYGQWLSGGKRRLCKVANPSSHLSVVGNFVGAILASRVGWEEPAKFFWAVGFAHYLVLFVTLYQRLPTSEALPKELHPVYSMFIAAPSAASIAWQNIYGEFDGCSRTCYFIALFLYASLVVRINFFTGFRFSVAWWSYTFPMTTVAVATIKYAEAVPCALSKSLALGLSFMASTMVCVLFVSTFLHAFVWQTLFPNDLAIAISNTKRKHFIKDKKPFKKAYDLRRWAKNTTTTQTNQKKDPGGENEERS